MILQSNQSDYLLIMSERLVIIAVDGSEQAMHAFQHYTERFHRPGNVVLVLHCPEMPDSIFKNLSIGKTESNQQKMEAAMDEEKNKWAEVKTKYESLLKENSMTGEFVCVPCHRAGEGIVKESNERKSTMVVMGTRGLGAIRRTIMGSVSDYVVHHAHCPIIVCRQ